MPRKARYKQAQQYVLVGVLVLGILWLSWLVWGIARKEEIARHAVRDTKAELAGLQERQAGLEANIAELATERGREGTLRQTHGVALPGEEVIIVVPPKEATTTAVELPWHKKLLGWFGWW